MFMIDIQNMADKAELSMPPMYNNERCWAIRLTFFKDYYLNQSELKRTNEKHKKMDEVRMHAVGMMFGLTRIAMSSRGRKPAPDVTPKPISLSSRSFWVPWREAKQKVLFRNSSVKDKTDPN